MRIRRRTPAPRLSFVDDVIVHESRGVNDFDNRSQRHCARAAVIQKLGGQKQQRRSNPLTTTGAQIFPNFRDRSYVGKCVLPELLLDREKVIPQQVEDLFPVNGCRRAQLCPSVFTTVRKTPRS